MSKLNKLNIQRFFQISLVITFATWLWLHFHIEKGYWIPFTLALLYGVIDEGAVSARLKDRVFGTILGIFLCQILVLYGEAHPVMSYPFYFILLFFIFLTLKKYLIGVTFITTIILWSNTFITPGITDIEHISYDRIINTLIAGAICFSSELIFRSYKHTQQLIFELEQQLQKQYIKYAIDCFEMILANKKFNSKKQIRKIRDTDLELQRLLQWVPHSFSNTFSKKINTYKHSIMQLKKIRTHILVIEYLSHHYPLETKMFIQKNKTPIFKIFLYLNNKHNYSINKIKVNLLKLKSTSQLEQQLSQALNALPKIFKAT